MLKGRIKPLGIVLLASTMLLAALFACTVSMTDETLFDKMNLPEGDPDKIQYTIEPSLPDGSVYPLPSIFSQAEIYASLVVPAYNEEKRIPIMLDETLEYLRDRQNKNPSFTFEIIVVNDGSKDNTIDVVLSYAKQNPEVRLIRQPRNMGKGAAIQAGCLHARGEIILMVDADGATKITEFAALEDRIQGLMKINKEAVVVGSRAHLEGESKSQRTFIRNFLGLSFHYLILLSGVRGIRDTQCGFKMFSREAARWLFPNQHIQRWCFDPELLVIARKRNMQIAEVPVEWNEIDGSKMKVSSMIKMAVDLIRIAAFHTTGIWSVKSKNELRQYQIEL